MHAWCAQVRHARLSAAQRFVQQVFDGFAVKYMASAVALLLYAAPLYFRDPSSRGSRDDITQDYIRSMRLLQNTSRCAVDKDSCFFSFSSFYSTYHSFLHVCIYLYGRLGAAWRMPPTKQNVLACSGARVGFMSDWPDGTLQERHMQGITGEPLARCGAMY